MTAGPLLLELRSRRDALRQLLELSRLQLQLIESDDYDALWRMQQQKQCLVAPLHAETPGTPSLRDRWAAGRDALPDEERRQCETLVREADACLQQLLEEEAISTAALERRLGETRSQLQSIAGGQKSRRLHHQPRQTTGTLMDLET